MPNLALVTGASSGIGRELARHHAAQGGDLIITARRSEALETLKAELEAAHGVAVHVIALDLGSEGGARALHDAVVAGGHEIDILINNAGFGGHGVFTDRDLERDLAMIDLNVKALVELTHRFGREMAARGRGRILNVSSTASYLPGPLQATYYATKAFVSSFSQAVAEELREKGVTVTALEPGPVDTEFFETANLKGTALGETAASPAHTAKVGYEAMLRGDLTVTDNPKMGFLLNWVTPFMPRRKLLKRVYDMQAKRAL